MLSLLHPGRPPAIAVLNAGDEYVAGSPQSICSCKHDNDPSRARGPGSWLVPISAPLLQLLAG
jgi:hypothetical protein